jgi:uncharacterized membrane protein (DUF2068 family)
MHATKKTLALRSIALFEAAKGVLVMLLGIGLVRIGRQNLDLYVAHLMKLLHVSPVGRLSTLLLQAADRTTDKGLWVLAVGAMFYAAVRFTEAVGLWHDRDWAEWFALLSGGMYLPWEAYSLLHHPHPFKWIVLLANLAIVLFMLVLRIRAEKLARHSRHEDGSNLSATSGSSSDPN